MIDYCPFCGSEESEMVITSDPLGHKGFIKCGHCAAQGSTFIEEHKHDLLEQLTLNWNQDDMRPTTLCHKVKRFFVQLQYDLLTCWGRY